MAQSLSCLGANGLAVFTGPSTTKPGMIRALRYERTRIELGLVRPREKLVGLHCQQTTQRALELEGETTASVEVFQLNLGRDDQLDVAVVELVHQVDKAPGHVVLGGAHLLDIGQQHRMEDFTQFDVVVLATRAIAQLTEVEPGHVITDLTRHDGAALDHQRLVFLHLAVLGQQADKALLQAFLGGSVQRPVEQLGLLQRTQTVVDTAVDVDDLGVLLEQGDGRQEARALKAVLVQAIRHDIGGGNQAHTVLEQLFQQGGEDHRVSNIADEEFVEADHSRLIGETLADNGQRVLLAFEGAHFFMHALHKAVEVRAHLALERQRIKKGVDQVGFATTHATPEVQALDRPLRFFAEQLAEDAGATLVGSDQIVIQALPVTHRSFLGSVMKEIRAFKVSLVAF